MATSAELLRQGRKDELWKRYCGFFDLTIDEFMSIQERLLIEQLQLLGACELGRRIIGADMPESLADFRQIAPITTYRDYVEYLEPQREDVLPVKPYCWMRTSGRSGEYTGKMVPTSHQFYSLTGKYLLATVMLASAKEKGDINLEEGGTFLYAVAPPPYISGTSIRAISEEFPFRFIPPIAEAEAMSFEERLTQAFLRSIETGIGHFVGIASVLLRMGEAFSQGSGQLSASRELLRPMAVYRIGKALVLSKLQRRSMLPRDLWNPRGIVASGMDVQIYKKRIESMWGCTPLEAYACTEFGTIAVQAWGAKSDGLTFAPDSALWEFMPEEEYHTWRQDPKYKPTTYLMNQVKPGRYVLVGTSFAGGAFVRYIPGDLISILGVRDEGLDIDLPQMVMESRVDDIIDLGSLVLLTERAIWQGIGCLDLSLVDWTARKQYTSGEKDPVIHLCVEGEALPPEQLAADLHNALVECVEDYATYYSIMKMNPFRVTTLTAGTFGRYLEQKQAEGADIGHLKPPRMQPSDEILARLLEISAELAG